MKGKKRTGTVPFFASVTLHLVALLIVVSFQASSIQRLDPVPIRIQLYSPPPSQLAPEPQPLPEEAVTAEVPDPLQVADPLPQQPDSYAHSARRMGGTERRGHGDLARCNRLPGTPGKEGLLEGQGGSFPAATPYTCCDLPH